MPAPTTMSEREYLDQQAADARAAMGQVWADIKSNAVRGIDPRLWGKQYPWIAAATGAVGGFFAAYALVPSKEQQALKRLAELHSKLSPPPPPTLEKDGRVADQQPAQARKGSSFFGNIGRELVHSLQPVLMSALTAGVTGKAMQPEGPQQPQPHENPYANAAEI